ncbi:hypothetical protein OM33_11015 [Pseudoalteromonas piratica]|uniref:DNA internalization-related competence protein ComEC/Rec2 n=1 Tax=Pseudoalteromonas piratica TaxID=1348114 RepID=A0A0A7EG60_9GAMM|nr:hypothetical protein OM33_11015 [Pseudoalteromonas piratica]
MSLFLLNTPVFFLTIALVVLVIVLIVPIIKTKIIIISALLLGLIYPIVYYHSVYDSHLSYQQLQEKQLVSGVIEAIDDYQYTYRLTLRAKFLAHAHIPQYKKLKLQLYLVKSKYNETVLNVGDEIETKVKLKPIVSTVNEGLFDGRLFNFFHGIKYKGSINHTSHFKLLTRKSENTYQHIETSHYAWLYFSILFGDTSNMPSKFKEATKQLGISHLFAVSGLHMGIVFGISYWLARICFFYTKKLKIGRVRSYIPYVFGILCCAVYLDLSSYATSAQRALIMLCVFCLCWQINRSYISYRALILALLIIILINPFVTLTVGFYFSFFAVLSILLSINIIKRLGIKHWAVKLLVLQSAITLSLLPFSVLFFNGVSSYSLLINLVAIPLFSLFCMPIILLIGLLSEIFDTAVLIAFFDPVIQFIVNQVYTIANYKVWLSLPLITWQLALLLSVSSLLLFYIPYSLYITLPIITFYLIQLNFVSDELKIHVLDVGHGLAVILSKNNNAVLYDLGARYQEYSYVKSVIFPTLQLNNLTLSKTIISHDDNDHSGGLKDIIASDKIDTVAGFGKACHFKAFWLEDVLFESIPNKGTFKSDNNNSCVVLVSYKGFKLLLTGDIEKQREYALRNNAKISNVDLLISPHHGSNSSSTDIFIKLTNPSWVIHSVNAYNRWQFPSIKVVTRYASNNVKQLATYKGAIKIQVANDAYRITTQGQAKKYWFLVQ